MLLKRYRLNSQKITLLLKGGLIPQAYLYPPEMRTPCDLLRRRLHLISHLLSRSSLTLAGGKGGVSLRVRFSAPSTPARGPGMRPRVRCVRRAPAFVFFRRTFRRTT